MTINETIPQTPTCDLSIIIVNYNTCEALQRCLESITAQGEGLALETIVIDNGSWDSSAAMARQTMPSAHVIELGYNTWFTGGNNLGIRLANGTYTLILNPDTVIQPGMLAAMLTYLREHQNVGGLTCQMYALDGKIQFTGSELPNYLDLLLGYTFFGALFFFWRNQRRRKMWYSGWDRQSTRPVGVIPASCLMAPHKLLQNIGTLDEGLKLYFPEDDLCKRIYEAGYEVHYLADAAVLHEGHSSTRQVQRLASHIYFDDLIVFTRKHHGMLAATLLKVLILPTRYSMDIVQRLREKRQL